jgi:hypothetical protein
MLMEYASHDQCDNEHIKIYGVDDVDMEITQQNVFLSFSLTQTTKQPTNQPMIHQLLSLFNVWLLIELLCLSHDDVDVFLSR